MAFLKGNKLGRGKKGLSGRKDARTEFEGLKDLQDIWEGNKDFIGTQLIKERIMSGKYGAKHIVALKAMEEGNVPLLMKLMDKLMPNKSDTNLNLQGKVDSELIIKILDK